MTITILDGGMGQELVRRAGRATPLWSTRALLDAPELVRQIHQDFFAAGAEVATANTYALLPDRLVKFALGDRLDELTQTACRIAADARDAAGHGQVAGSMGPLGFSYRPDLAPPPEQAAEIYAAIAAVQARIVDVLLLETMSSVDQARGGLMGAQTAGKPVWLALSVMDEDGTRLRSGEALSDIEALLAEFRPDRVLLNCARPEAVSQGLPILAQFDTPFGAYANGFTQIDPRFNTIGATTDLLMTRTDVGPDSYADFAENWADAGATLIGGCCEIGPEHIAALTRRLKPDAPRPVAAPLDA